MKYVLASPDRRPKRTAKDRPLQRRWSRPTTTQESPSAVASVTESDTPVTLWRAIFTHGKNTLLRFQCHTFKYCTGRFYLTPGSNFPLRTGTKITACCGLWFGSGVTFAFPSTTFHRPFSFSISTWHGTLTTTKEIDDRFELNYEDKIPWRISDLMLSWALYSTN